MHREKHHATALLPPWGQQGRRMRRLEDLEEMKQLKAQRSQLPQQCCRAARRQKISLNT
jgi:hypothetical protein